MSKSFADMINYFQRRVHCIVIPCLIFCSAPDRLSLSMFLGSSSFQDNLTNSLPCLSFVSSWLALFYVRYLHLLDLIPVHVPVNYPPGVKLIYFTSSCCSGVKPLQLGGPGLSVMSWSSHDGFELGTR